MENPAGISIEKLEDVIVYSIKGHFDASLATRVNDEVQDVIIGSFLKVIFDLSELTYISSAGLRVLLLTAKKMQAKGGGVSLCSVGPGVQRVLDISGFTKVFPSYENRDAAIAAV